MARLSEYGVVLDLQSESSADVLQIDAPKGKVFMFNGAQRVVQCVPRPHVWRGMEGTMRRTIDTQTGREFRYNSTAWYCGKRVPQRITSRTCEYLHPDRVEPKLLAKLNPEKDGAPCQQ